MLICTAHVELLSTLFKVAVELCVQYGVCLEFVNNSIRGHSVAPPSQEYHNNALLAVFFLHFAQIARQEGEKLLWQPLYTHTRNTRAKVRYPHITYSCSTTLSVCTC